MADEKTYFLQLANWLTERIDDVSSALDVPSTAHLGVELPDTVLLAPAVKLQPNERRRPRRRCATQGAVSSPRLPRRTS